MKELQYFLISVHLVCFSPLSYRCLFVSATLITRSAPKDKLFAAHEKLMRNPECCPVVVLVFVVFQSVHKLARSRRPFLHSVLMQIFLMQNILYYYTFYLIWYHTCISRSLNPFFAVNEIYIFTQVLWVFFIQCGSIFLLFYKELQY